MQKFTKLVLLLTAIFSLELSHAQLTLPITFDNSGVTYTMTDFDGGTTAVMANPFPSGINTTSNVLQMIKNAGQPWGGTKLNLSAPLDFSTNNTFKMKVYSPRVGCPVLFKLEESNGTFVERTTNTTVANAWEELSWNFSGTASNLFTDLTFIYDLGVMGDGSANFTFYQDEIEFVAGSAASGLTLPITFEAPGVSYSMIDFNGGATTLLPNPFSGGINTSTTVLRMIKNADQVWGGSKLMLASTLDFTTNNTFKMKVYSPRVGCPVLFKLEDPTGAISVQKTATTSIANAWEELTWDFTGTASGTYNSLVFIYDLGVMGDGSANFTFYQDDIQFVQGSGSGLTQIDLPISFEDPTVDYTVTDFGGNATTLGPDPQNGANTVAITTKTVAAQTWAGTTMSTALGFANVIPFTATNRKMSVQVYSPDAGIPVRLKVEVHGQGAQSVETEAMTTGVNTWEYLTFDFNNEVPGTLAFDPSFPYDMASIFFNFGTDGATAGSKVYYWDNVQFGVSTDISNPIAENVVVFPNPASTALNISLPSSLLAQSPSYMIMDLTGRNIATGVLTQNTLNIQSLPSGMFVLQISTASGAINKRFVKQ